MAANTNKRIPIKHIRDGAKARYPKQDHCAICNTTELLELHHFTGLTNLLDKWQKETGTPLDTDEQVLAIRDQFIAEHEYELFEAVVTLCEPHHSKLHSIYGKSPKLSSAKAQERWVQIQKDKNNGVVSIKPEKLGNVSEVESGPRDHSKKRGLFSGLISNTDYLAGFRKIGDC